MTINIENEINGINNWISQINGRLSIIESLINEEEAKKLMSEIAAIKRILQGDSDLNVPPIYDIIDRLNAAINDLRAYQAKDQEYHHDMKMIIAGMVVMHLIGLVLSIIGIFT